jgi:colanic acid/amylovoran biosynthesis protein
MAERPERSTICILGASFDVGNRGVLALGASLARLAARVRPDAAIAYHYGHAAGGRRRVAGPSGDLEVTVRNCRLSLRSAPAEHIFVILALAVLYRLGIRGPARRNGWLRSLLSADFVGDVRGGDSFSDIYGMRRFLAGSLPLLSVAILGRPYALLPQTYGPFRSGLARTLAAVLVRRASVVLTRDRNCVPLVQALAGRTPAFCPDVAFTLEPRRPAVLRLAPDGATLGGDRLLVGVNVSGLLYIGGYTRRNMFGLASDYRALIDRLLDHLLATPGVHVLLVPHVLGQEEEEEAVCRTLLSRLGARHPGRVSLVDGALDEGEIKWVIGQTDAFVGARMHACIAALSQGVPTIGLAYSDKFLGVFESIGMGDAVVDLRAAAPGEVVRRVTGMLARRQDVAATLATRMPAVRDQVVRTFETLLAPSAAPRDPVPDIRGLTTHA